MKSIKSIAYAVLLAGIVALTGCFRVPFTQTFKTSAIKTDSAAIEKIQFYIGNTIVLERTSVLPIDTAVVGKVSFENGIYKQVIHIRKGTNAICSNINTGRQVAIVGPGPGEEIVFDNNAGYYMFSTINKKVKYNGQEFTIAKGAGARLMVSKKTVRPQKSVTYAQGMKLKVDKAKDKDDE